VYRKNLIAGNCGDKVAEEHYDVLSAYILVIGTHQVAFFEKIALKMRIGEIAAQP